MMGSEFCLLLAFARKHTTSAWIQCLYELQPRAIQCPSIMKASLSSCVLRVACINLAFSSHLKATKALQSLIDINKYHMTTLERLKWLWRPWSRMATVPRQPLRPTTPKEQPPQNSENVCSPTLMINQLHR